MKAAQDTVLIRPAPFASCWARTGAAEPTTRARTPSDHRRLLIRPPGNPYNFAHVPRSPAVIRTLAYRNGRSLRQLSLISCENPQAPAESAAGMPGVS